MTSAELVRRARPRANQLKKDIRNGYFGPATLTVGHHRNGEAFFVLTVPNEHALYEFKTTVAIGNNKVNVMIKCGDARFGITTRRIVKETA